MGLRIQMARMIWKPLTAAAGMAGYLAFGPSAPLVLTIVVAVLGYGAVLAVLMALPATDARGASAAFDGAP